MATPIRNVQIRDIVNSTVTINITPSAEASTAVPARRRGFTIAEKLKHVRECRLLGTPAAHYCRKHGLSLSAFKEWRKAEQQLSKQPKQNERKTFESR
jgi:hypothetical protein